MVSALRIRQLWSIDLEHTGDHFIVRCLYVLGYGIGSAVADTLLPVAIGIVAAGLIGLTVLVVYRRLSAPRRRRNPLGI
jgi:hypothetical protein